MSKKSTSTNITSDNTDNINNSKSVSLYDANIQNNNQQQQDLNESVNRALDQTKDNINRSIQESKNQIPHYNNIVNSYQEQTLQAAKELSEHFIESQKTIIRAIQSSWSPYQRNINTTVNSWNSSDAAANAYSRFVSNIADNTVSALRTTNNLVFASLDAYKTTVLYAKDTTKQILDINANIAKTFEQNSKEVAGAAQDANTRLNTSISSGSNTAGTTSTTTTSSTSAA